MELPDFKRAQLVTQKWLGVCTPNSAFSGRGRGKIAKLPLKALDVVGRDPNACIQCFKIDIIATKLIAVCSCFICGRNIRSQSPLLFFCLCLHGLFLRNLLVETNLSAVNERGWERKGPPEIIQKFRLRNWPISSEDFPMTPMEGTVQHFGPF